MDRQPDDASSDDGDDMKMRLPWTLCAISLALNVFFVGGVVWSKLQDQPVESQIEASGGAPSALDSLNLTADQKIELQALRERTSQRWRSLSSETQGVLDTVLDHLAAPRFDEQGVESLLSERMTQRAVVISDIMADLHDYLDQLTPEQRERFLELSEDPGFLRALFRGEGARSQAAAQQ